MPDNNKKPNDEPKKGTSLSILNAAKLFGILANSVQYPIRSRRDQELSNPMAIIKNSNKNQLFGKKQEDNKYSSLSDHLKQDAYNDDELGKIQDPKPTNLDQDKPARTVFLKETKEKDISEIWQVKPKQDDISLDKYITPKSMKNIEGTAWSLLSKREPNNTPYHFGKQNILGFISDEKLADLKLLAFAYGGAARYAFEIAQAVSEYNSFVAGREQKGSIFNISMMSPMEKRFETEAEIKICLRHLEAISETEYKKIPQKLQDAVEKGKELLRTFEIIDRIKLTTKLKKPNNNYR